LPFLPPSANAFSCFSLIGLHMSREPPWASSPRRAWRPARRWPPS